MARIWAPAMMACPAVRLLPRGGERLPTAIHALHACFRHAPDLRMVALDDARLTSVWLGEQRLGLRTASQLISVFFRLG